MPIVCLWRGSGRWASYRVPDATSLRIRATSEPGTVSVNLSRPYPYLSDPGVDIQKYVQQPSGSRKPVGYNRGFLHSYQPNDTFYLSETERAHLHDIGRLKTEPADTDADELLNRLLIDLTWNSSHLEGNTYSLLNTMHLLENGEEAEGKDPHETQVILNHKEATEFLVDSSQDIGFNRFTVLNLHAILADNLLDDPTATGRLRYIPIGIKGSVFHPPGVAQLIEEYFNRILTTASLIVDPFEQAFFTMVQLPYLQSFDDANRQVSRLTANIPLIKGKLLPLSFEDVFRTLYTESLLGVYELNRIELLRDMFLWAYKRSAVRYVAVQQSLGEPDPFRSRHRTLLREVVGEVVRKHMN